MSNSHNKNKIVYLITKSNWGGAQRYVFDLATTMAAGYDVTVIVGGHGELVDRLVELGITVLTLPELERDTRLLKDFGVFVRLYRILKKIKPDIIHLNSSKIGGIGALAGRLAKVPHIIFTAHGWAFNENRGQLSKAVIAGLYWITIFLSHITIVVSRSMATQIDFFPYIKHKIVLIHNGIPERTLLTHKQARLELFPHLDAKDIIIGSIGELHPIKGHRYAIEAIASLIKKHPHIKYAIIGEGEVRSQLEHFIKEKGLSHNVVLLGKINNAADYLKAFDFFVLPSLSEAFGYVVLEAGMAKLPVIASAVGGVTEIIDDMKSGILIQPQKSSEITSAIELLLTHKDLAKTYALNLRENVEKNYTLKKMIKRTDELYTKILTQHPSK